MALGAALPVELDLDAVVALGGERRTVYADDDGRLRARRGGLGMDAQPMLVFAQRAISDVGTDGLEAVAVQRRW